MAESDNDEYVENYTVKVFKRARADGQRLDLSGKAKKRIIKQLKTLKYWPAVEDEFDYESAFGSIEFKFYSEQKWIRVFVFKDEMRKIMHVIHVCKKKDNQIEQQHKIAIETQVTRLKAEIRQFQRQIEYERKKSQLQSVKGGKGHGK